MIEHLEILVEERSAEEALRALLPRFIGSTTFEVYSYGGKRDLLAKLPSRLRGYAAWLPGSWRVIVLVDRDGDDCMALKRQLTGAAVEAGLVTRSKAGGRAAAIGRIAIEELEAWYFGDWEAVRQAYPKVSASIPEQSRYRDPDAISGGTWEAFEKILQAGGYMKGGLRKGDAARAVAAQMQPERNKSRSFQVFWRAVTATCEIR